jgi:3-methyladenine DNA glycosylase AlkC
MADLLKNIYNEHFFEHFVPMLHKVYPELNKKKFKEDVLSAGWKNLELKQRMRRIAETLGAHLPSDFKTSSGILCALIDELFDEEELSYGFQYMFIPDFIQVYGLECPDVSIPAMECITRYSSCEFAIRPFLIQYPDRMLKQCLKWTKHDHEMVRRLASEGTRPRLPWGMSVPWIKKDPRKVLPVLELLKSDSSETVRRSVANSINDMAKDDADVVLEIVDKWKGISPEIDKLIRHASRTLLKRSNSEALAHFGIKKLKSASIESLKANKKKIKIGDDLVFSFEMELKSPAKVRLEYAIDYVKANGKTSRKVFKLSEGDFSNGKHSLAKKQSFKDFTTRKHYPGKHQLSILLNGEEKAWTEFLLAN